MSNNGSSEKTKGLSNSLKGEIIIWLITLGVALIGVMTPIVNLNTTITELNDTIQNLNKLVDKTVLEVDDISNRLTILETELHMYHAKGSQ
jgi:cell division protein FtsL